MRDSQTNDDVRLVSARQQLDGWRMTSLLLPTINPGDLVKLESRTVQAFQRVEAVRHYGDSAGGDWQSELQLVDPHLSHREKRKT